jgi:DNA-binding transcriptional LysR family regulator
VGDPVDSDMIVRKLTDLEEITCASPAYIEQFGTPQNIEALEGHQMVGFRSTATGAVMPLEFVQDGGTRTVSLPTSITVNGADTLAHCARLGLGIIQKPRYSAAEDLAAGRLVELLSDTPPAPSPVSIFYPRERYLSPRMRVFIDWAVASLCRSELHS